MQTVWITKYALTKGIHQAEFKGFFEESEGVFDETTVEINDTFNTLYFKGDWHKTEAEAKKKANEMRLKKIKSLEKQIERLKKLEF